MSSFPTSPFSFNDLPPIWPDDEGESSIQTPHELRKREVHSIIGEYIMGIQHDESQNTRRKTKVFNRDREGSSATLWQQYFAEPRERVYDDVMFCRRFCMRRDLFLRTVGDVTSHDRYFQQKPYACNVLGFTPITKCTAAMRILGYGLAYDQVDEYLSIRETTAKKILHHFVEAIIAVYHDEYFRWPTPQEVARLKHAGAEHGFPKILGSVDCMHWKWKNCSAGWKGQYMGRSRKTSIILEAVAFYDLRIWHAFFGTTGSCNDINVLDRSPLFDNFK